MWDRGNERFGDMAAFSRARLQDRRAAGHLVPAAARRREPPRLAAPRTQPAVPRPEPSGRLAIVERDTRRLREWGYGLIKHDYTSFDLLGRWGFSMGATLTDDGWRFADRAARPRRS